MASTGTKEKWSLFYDEKSFRSFENLLLIELINKDYSNEKFLAAKYAEEDLPSDPASVFLNSVTDNQLQQLKDTAAAKVPAYSLPTKTSVLKDPKKVLTAFKSFINEQSGAHGCTNNRVATLKTKTAKLLEDELDLYKKLAKTLLHKPALVSKAAFGAGRALFQYLREKNKLNKTQAQANEQLKQFLNFRMLPNESLTDYKDRLDKVKNECETSKIDPQPISARLYKRMYTTGVLHIPAYEKALNKIEDYLERDFAYLERKLNDASGVGVQRIREMHQPGISTALAAVVPPPPPPPASPAPYATN